MSHQGTHAATVARTLAQHRAGHVFTARLGAYIAGADAAEAGIEVCPFDTDTLPDLAQQWVRGRAHTTTFRAGRQRPAGHIDRLSARARRPVTTHASATHPKDDTP